MCGCSFGDANIGILSCLNTRKMVLANLTYLDSPKGVLCYALTKSMLAFVTSQDAIQLTDKNL